MRIIILLLLLGSLIGCNQKTVPKKIEQIVHLSKDLKEISGIAFKENMLYCIEDSGNENQIIVTDSLGEIQRTITITNIENKDWEDIVFDASGNLYIGDFGNNQNDRKDLAIYKIDAQKLNESELNYTDKISFYYPEQTSFPPKKKDFMFDAEAFFVYKNNFYLFTKNRSKNFDGTSYIYKIPNKPGYHKAELINTIKTCSDYHNCAITSAAISPDGLKFVLLSHSKIWIFENYTQDNITKAKVTELNLNHYSQKEAVCFENNHLLLIADEKVKKTGGNLYQVNLQNFNK